jgi:hypothetical protein
VTKTTLRDPLASLIRRPWRDAALPVDATGIPTMLSKDERRLLYGLARDYARDDAAIVDAGCFLGGSTGALLAGVRDRMETWTGAPVASYDLFRVEAYTMEKFFGDEPGVEVGASFRDRFDANLARFDVPHVVHQGDITRIGWGRGPIDVLFLDVLKSWEINDAVLRDFFPALVPGRSVIVHQDYAGGYMPWIAITVELMRDSLLLLDWMEWGSHVFFVERELPADVIEEGVSALDTANRFELLDRAISRADGWVRGMLEIDRAALIVDRDGEEAGLATLASIAERYRGHGFVLSTVAAKQEGLETNWAYGTTSRHSWSSRLASARRRLGSALLRG